MILVCTLYDETCKKTNSFIKISQMHSLSALLLTVHPGAAKMGFICLRIQCLQLLNKSLEKLFRNDHDVSMDTCLTCR